MALKNWERVEKIVANLIGGKRTPGSGNGHIKGDIVRDDIMIECKTTINDKIQLQRDWFEELEKYISKKEVFLVAQFGTKIIVFEPYELSTKCRPWKTITMDEEALTKYEIHDNIFPGLDWYWTIYPDGLQFLKELGADLDKV